MGAVSAGLGAPGALGAVADLGARVQQPASPPPIDYGAVAPVLVVLGIACVGVLVEAFLPRHQRWSAQVTLSIAAVVLAGAALARSEKRRGGKEGRSRWSPYH